MSDSHAGLKAGAFTIQAQERIVFGKPAGEAVAEEVARLGAKRVFVTSTRSLSQLPDGPLQRVVKALGERHVGTYAQIRAHSPREDVIAGAKQARAARADLLVAVGGGSVIDATKAMQLCFWEGIEAPEAFDPYLPTGAKAAGLKPPADGIRLISVSTTLSASEFTPVAGVTDTRTNSKQLFIYRPFAPLVVVLDPAATLNTPDWLLYCTGVRAVDHAVEGYCNPAAHPATEALSLQGLALLAKALPAIKADPKSLQPRLDAQFGIWQAVAAFASGITFGASHGIGYVLGATYGVAHGHTSCVMLPAVMRWNAKQNGERQKALSAAMGQPERPAADLVAELIKGLDQPGSLRAVNIKRENFDDIATRAMNYDPVKANPRKITGPADVKEILELAW